MNLLQQGLESLPNELVIIIFKFIEKITDKRQFLRTCNFYNNLLKGLIVNLNECEIEYFSGENVPHSIEQTSNMDYQKYLSKRDYCVEKFSIELCYDSYFGMIPISYINKNNEVIIRLLIKHGKLELLQIAFDNSIVFDNFTFLIASEHEQLEVLKWLKNKGIFNDRSISCSLAALNGHLETIKWLKQNGCLWNVNTCAYAAFNGHLDVLKWIRENGCAWTFNTVAFAAFNGHLKVIKWAMENGSEWGIWTCANAAENGHLDVLKYARENGCEWDTKTWHNAIKNGNIDVINWLKENNCPII